MEIVFVEPKTNEEAQVLIDQHTGKVDGAYISGDSGIFDEDHEDHERFSGLTWKVGRNSVYVYCNQPEQFLRYLLDEWELTGDDKPAWDGLTARWPALHTVGT